MKINHFQNIDLLEDYIDIHYKTYTQKIDAIIAAANADSQLKLRAKLDDAYTYIAVSDVYYFESVDRKYIANLKNESLQISQTLKEIEDAFTDLGFVRINKSMILNVNMVQKMSMDLNMRMLAHLTNGEVLQINRSYKKAFNKKLEAYVENKIVTKEDA